MSKAFCLTGCVLALAILLPAGFAQAQQSNEADLRARMELSRQMHEFRPVEGQVNAAIDQVAQTRPPEEREAFQAAMRKILNYEAIKKISVEAMAETYTEAELKAMVEYFARPEAQSASDKEHMYAEKVYPEIIRMLDQAMMRLKTGQ